MSELRRLKFSSLAELIDDLKTLQRGCKQLGNWSLPQTAWHLSLALRSVVPVTPGTISTPEQAASKKERLDYLLAGNPMGDGRPSPPGLDPLKAAPADIDQTAVNSFIAGLKSLEANTQPQINFGRFGLVTNDEFKRFILIHSAHHLNKLIPTA